MSESFGNQRGIDSNRILFSRQVLSIVQWEDSPGIVRIETFDLDDDGRSEWLLETASRYGDGFYSNLWHVDTGTPGSRPVFTSLPVPRSSGESAAGNAAASWWEGGRGLTLWIGGADGQGAWLEPFRYGSAKLAPAKAPETLKLGIEVKSRDYWDGHALILERKRSGSSVAKFPIALRGYNPVWAAGAPLTDPKAAREWQRRNPNGETIRPRPRR